MATTNAGIRLRPNNIQENLGILRTIRSTLKVDDRSSDELHKLFVSVNAKCVSQTFKAKGSCYNPIEKSEKTFTQYGPVPSSPPGSWWGIRMDCARDGVHGPFNEKIQDGPFGAFSICTSHLNEDEDVDLGEFLTYTGHEYISTDLVKDSLILSYKNKIPLRLVRGYNLSNEFSPKTGYRYDGLYTVIAYWIGESRNSKKHLKFALSRIINQDKPPWSKSISLPQHTEENKPTMNTARSTRRNNCLSSGNIKESSKVFDTSNLVQTEKFVYEKSLDRPKNVNTSAIVARQVFKKCISSPKSEHPSKFHTSEKPPSHKNDINCTVNHSPPTSWNTNIRTDLHVSPNNLQQDSKKSTSMTFCRTFKPTRLMKPTQVELNDKETPLGRVRSESEIESIKELEKIRDTNLAREHPQFQCNSNSELRLNLNSTQLKTSVTITQRCENSSRGIVDEFNPTSEDECEPNLSSKCGCKAECDSNSITCREVKNNTCSKNYSQHFSKTKENQAKQTSNDSFSTMCDSFLESGGLIKPSSSLESLTPDILVSLLVKEKYHPMAKLLIGNMIGLENEESAMLKAYNALTSKADKEEENVIKERPKTQNNIMQKKIFQVRRRERVLSEVTRKKLRRNGMNKKQGREITDLIVDSNFNPGANCHKNCNINLRNVTLKQHSNSQRKRFLTSEILKKKKLINDDITQTRRIQFHAMKLVKKQNRETVSSKMSESRMPKRIIPVKMIDQSVQCTLLQEFSIDKSSQTGISCMDYENRNCTNNDVKLELIDVDDIKSELDDARSSSEECSSSEPESVNKCSNSDEIIDRQFVHIPTTNVSAFVPVNTIDSSIRIARLRSIGFRPIGSSPPLEKQTESHREVDAEYNKYTNEETTTVGYMNEELHFENIETEDSHISNTFYEESQMASKSKKRGAASNEDDFDRPWHGWKKIIKNGSIYWTGY